ncbi:MAG: YHYH protein, partial [Pseudomonadota bacterium]
SARGTTGQSQQGSMRAHTVTQSSGVLNLAPATQGPVTTPQVSITVSNGIRRITSNNIANHNTGQFPNVGNPNRITAQRVVAELPANPSTSTVGVAKEVKEPGWAVNGVKFDPGAAEFYQGNPSLGWQYNALSGAIALGLDVNHAHVQPTGAYHYHGVPTLLLDALLVTRDRHSPIVGWAKDGFPIYAFYGAANAQTGAGVAQMTSSWVLKSGARPMGAGQPGGTYDGTFTQDFEYIAGRGTLDDCNGRFTVTPDYPNGTYAYFITNTWPVIPRCLKGAVSADMLRSVGGGGRR